MTRPPTPPAAADMRRGEIWWVDFEPTKGAEIRKVRPAIVISADGLNRVRRTVVVVPLSTGPEPRPPIIVPAPSAGPKAVAICDQLRAVDRVRMSRLAGRLSADDMRAVGAGLRAILEL